MKTKVYFLIIAIVFCFGFLSCATSRGNLYDETVKADKDLGLTSSPTYKTTINEDSNDQSLFITSVPDNADVFIDNRYYGRTPIEIDDLEKGTYRIRLEHANYEPYESFLYFEKKSMTYSVELVRLTGYLIVNTVPSDAEVIIGGENISNAKARVPVGTYNLVVRRFGYEEHTERVTITEDRLTSVDVVLSEAEFTITGLTLSRKRFNPENSGLLGNTEMIFYVTAPGNGTLTIKDSGGSDIFSYSFPPFATWRQSVLWNGRDNNNIPYPDGVYEAELECVSAKDERMKTVSAEVTIDHSIVITYASLFSGSAGTLFAPTASVLPESVFQLSMLTSAHGENTDDGFVLRAPSDLFIRYGFTDSLELDCMFGIIPSNTSAIPVIANASIKWLFLNSNGSVDVRIASYLRATFHYGTGADTFGIYTGAGFGVPLELRIGIFSLLLTPEIVLSPWKVTYTSDYDATTGLYSWLYLRSGIQLDPGGGFTIGASTVFRTLPFAEGFAFDPPYKGAAEIHYLVPDTQFFLSGLATVDFSSASSYFVSGGIGLGFIF